jgi:gas vesicle protein
METFIAIVLLIVAIPFWRHVLYGLLGAFMFGLIGSIFGDTGRAIGVIIGFIAGIQAANESNKNIRDKKNAASEDEPKQESNSSGGELSDFDSSSEVVRNGVLLNVKYNPLPQQTKEHDIKPDEIRKAKEIDDTAHDNFIITEDDLAPDEVNEVELQHEKNISKSPDVIYVPADKGQTFQNQTSPNEMNPEETTHSPNRAINPFLSPIKNLLRLLNQIEWKFPFVAQLIEGVVLFLSLVITTILFLTIGIASQIETTLRNLINNSTKDRSSDSHVEKSALAIAAGVYMIFWLPFWIILLPFNLLGWIWKKLGYYGLILVIVIIGAVIYGQNYGWSSLIEALTNPSGY